MIEEEKIKAHCHKFNFKNQIPLKSRKKWEQQLENDPGFNLHS